MGERPILKIRKTTFEKSLEVTSFVLVGLMLFLSIYAWSELPDKIPVHFNFYGEPDRWGGKGSILIMPIIGFFVVKVTFFLGKAPHMFNYPVKVTKENAARLYLESRRMLILVNFELAIMLTLLHLDTILQAYEKTGIGSWVTPLLLVLILATISLTIYRMFQLK